MGQFIDAAAIDVFAQQNAAAFRAEVSQRRPHRIASFDRADHVKWQKRVMFDRRRRDFATAGFQSGLTETSEVQGHLPPRDAKDPRPQLAPPDVESVDAGQRGQPGFLMDLFGGGFIAVQQMGNERKNIVGMAIVGPCPSLRLAFLQLLHQAAVGVVGHREPLRRMDRVS